MTTKQETYQEYLERQIKRNEEFVTIAEEKRNEALDLVKGLESKMAMYSQAAEQLTRALNVYKAQGDGEA